MGVGEAVERGLSARAQSAGIQRMRRVAFELDDTTIARLGDHAAGSGAFAAGGCVVARDPGNRFVRRREVANEVAGLLPATDSGDDSGRRADYIVIVAPHDGCV